LGVKLEGRFLLVEVAVRVWMRFGQRQGAGGEEILILIEWELAAVAEFAGGLQLLTEHFQFVLQTVHVLLVQVA
jgi:hypothetical protein